MNHMARIFEKLEFSRTVEKTENLNKIHLVYGASNHGKRKMEFRPFLRWIFLSGDQFCIFFSKLVRDVDLILFAS